MPLHSVTPSVNWGGVYQAAQKMIGEGVTNSPAEDKMALGAALYSVCLYGYFEHEHYF